jgi:hypothetical protein
MPCVQRAVHVRVGYCAKEFRVLGSKFSGGDGVEGDLCSRRGIGLEYSFFLPLLLVYLLPFCECVAFLGLKPSKVSKRC